MLIVVWPSLKEFAVSWSPILTFAKSGLTQISPTPLTDIYFISSAKTLWFIFNKFKDKISINKLFTNAQLSKMLDNTYWVNGLKSSFGYNPLLCKCGSLMILNLELSYFP